jgi:23S rRNA maturation mini-RNase III
MENERRNKIIDKKREDENYLHKYEVEEIMNEYNAEMKKELLDMLEKLHNDFARSVLNQKQYQPFSTLIVEIKQKVNEL